MRKLVDLLKASGRFPWIDVSDLLGGERWQQRIDQEIDRADLFYLFWSRHARGSHHVKAEWERALTRVDREKLARNFLIPVMLDDDRPEADHPLARFNYILLG